MPGEKKHVAFVLYPGVTPLDLVGPLTVLRTAGPGWPFETVVVGERVAPLATDTPLRMVPARAFAEVPEPFGVIVPGGGPAAVDAMRDEMLLAYVRSAALSARVVGATGNGALILAAAGLLPGRRAASHWAYGEQLARLGATYARERWVKDGKFLTAAGGTAGIDAMLYLVSRFTGEAGARLAQLAAEYDPEPPFGRINTADMDADLGAMLRAPAPPQREGERTIAAVLYPGLTALDLIGPLQVLAVLERVAPRYRVAVVGERAEPVDTDLPVRLIPDRTFAEVPQPYAVVVPGGRLGTIRALSDPAIRAYVGTTAESAEVVASVCTGSLILGAVGLLAGRPATTNWFFSEVLEQFGATYRRQRWVEDGNVITAAGVSAGIDGGLYLVARLTDGATARRVQAALDYEPWPPFGRIDWANVPLPPRLLRGAIGLAAPLLAARPKRLTRSDRRARARTPGAGTSP
jgi:transcriptional regulator GlxA family with amidase domain